MFDSMLIDEDHIAARHGHGSSKVSRKNYHTIHDKADKKNAEIIDQIYKMS